MYCLEPNNIHCSVHRTVYTESICNMKTFNDITTYFGRIVKFCVLRCGKILSDICQILWQNFISNLMYKVAVGATVCVIHNTNCK
jgi:hypothetical protein